MNRRPICGRRPVVSISTNTLSREGGARAVTFCFPDHGSESMKIPGFWSKATVQETDREGREIASSCWRSSDKSPEDAHESALVAARRILSAVLRKDRLNRYEYGQVPLREEVLERFTNSRGELLAALTRNRYGAIILNTARAMFIDLDFPPVSPGNDFRYWLAKIFRKSTRSPDAAREENTRRTLERYVTEHPSWSVRVYRTLAGLRALVTHELFDPTSGPTLDVLQTLGADPLYVRLCQAQECFRARLTPKPWRCGHTSNVVPWPREGVGPQQQFDEWEAGYSSRQANFATCRFLGTLGGNRVHPDVERIIELHDDATRCNEKLSLA